MRNLNEHWPQLPLVLTWGDLELRWMPPLMDRGGHVILEDMGTEAWGRLTCCGWDNHIPEAPFVDGSGAVRVAWLEGAQRAARRLADEGRRTGPIGGEDVWLSWLLMSLSSSASVVRAAVEAGELPLRVAGQG